MFSGGNTCTYTNPGFSYVTDTFTVPAGITSIHVVLVGGKGGGNDGLNGSNENGYGGFGAVVIGDLAVTPSSTLDASVGFNGLPICCGIPGGGGGASDIRTVSGDLSTRLMVSGGGGGGSEACCGLGGGGGTGGTVGSSTGTSGANGSSGALGGGFAATSVANLAWSLLSRGLRFRPGWHTRPDNAFRIEDSARLRVGVQSTPG